MAIGPGSVSRYYLQVAKGHSLELKSLRRCLNLKKDYVQSSLVPNAWANQMSIKHIYFGTGSSVRDQLVSV